LRSDELLDVVKRTRFLELKAGDTLFKEGDEGDSIFIIVSGELDIVSTVGEKEVPLARLKAVSGRNDFFGEFGFFSNSRRKATVRGSTDAELLEIKKSGMLEISAKYPAVGRVLFEFYKTRVVDRIMAISKIFGTLSKDERTEVLKRLTPKVFRGGSLAVREGAQGDTMYLIKEGRAEVWTSGPSGGVKTLSTLGPGEFFGEVALATARPRVASVRAITTLHTVEFSRELVKDILAAHPEIKTALEEVIKERIADLVMVRKGRLL
jgi:cAMP-dependent protein kinase regulator